MPWKQVVAGPPGLDGLLQPGLAGWSQSQHPAASCAACHLLPARQVFSAVLLSAQNCCRWALYLRSCGALSLYLGLILLHLKSLLTTQRCLQLRHRLCFFLPQMGHRVYMGLSVPGEFEHREGPGLSNALAVGLLRIGSLPLLWAVTCLVDEGHRHIPAP